MSRDGASLVASERARFLALVAAAPAALLLGHLLPASDVGLAVRLAGAAACVLLVPGALVLRAVAWPSSPSIAVAASFSVSVAVAGFALAAVFLADASIVLAAGILVVVALCAAVPALFRGESTAVPSTERRALGAVLVAAVPFAGAAWWAAGPLTGDAFFHAARAQKLAEFDTLRTLTTVTEFENGGLHPGYAFPLWHGVDALVARFAGVDAADTLVYLPAVLVPLALVLAYAAGSAVFRSPAGGLAFVVAQVAVFGLHRRSGGLGGTGLFEAVTQPQAASHLLLATATLALAFTFVRDGGAFHVVALASAALALSIVHGSYTPFVALVIGGFMLARVVLTRGWEPLLSRTALALGAILVPFGLFVAAIYPTVRGSAGFTPSTDRRALQLNHYENAFATVGDWFSMSPDAIARDGVVVAAGLLAVPLAGLAAQRLWAALVLGGSLAVLTVLLVPPIFTAVSDLVSISQSRRLPQFLPISFAVAGGCIVLGRIRAVGVGLAAAAGLSLVLLYPGEYSYAYREGGPGWAVWVAVGGGVVALVLGALLRTRGPSSSPWAVAAAIAFVIPVAFAGLARLEQHDPTGRLTPGIVDAVRAETAPGEVVFSDRMTAYSIAAFAPVYINASAPGHTTPDPEHGPRTGGAYRAGPATRFFGSRTLTPDQRRAILESAGADWVLVNGQGRRRRAQDVLRHLPLVYEDDRFALYRVSG